MEGKAHGSKMWAFLVGAISAAGIQHVELQAAVRAEIADLRPGKQGVARNCQ